jgi:DNA-binding transcriptional LysR family regulator
MADRKRTEPSWDDLRTLLALGRHGSLSAAARSLDVSHATIARRIQSLERAVGGKLVERRADGYILTAAGAEAVSVAGEMDLATRTLARDHQTSSPRGLVRVNAPSGLVHGFLTARLVEAVRRYPRLDLELTADLRAISLERHEADIAIRLCRPQDGDIIARPLATIGYGLYATPDLCERVAANEKPAFIGFDEAAGHVPEAEWLTRTFPRARIVFRASNQFAQSIAARSGAGIALLPHYIGRPDAQLRECDLGVSAPTRDAYILTRRRDRKNETVRLIANDVAEIFTAERHLLR